MMELLGWLRELMARPSPTGREGEVQRFLVEALRGMGFDVILEPVLPGRPNLYAVRGRPGYLLATHVDTVPAWGCEGFTVEDGTAYGRGVADPKGQIAALLTALEGTEAPAFVALFVDEEKGGKGSEAFRDPWGMDLKGAVVLEPTELRICNLQFGSVEFEAEVGGEEMHGATYDGDKNAILRCSKLIQDLCELPFLGGSGITVGRIEGGRDPQVIPDSCKFTADIPVPPGVKVEEALDEVLATLDRYGAEYTLLSVDEPTETSPDSQVAQDLLRAATETLKRPVSFGVMSAWTDAANLSKKGMPTVVFGAGSLALCHTKRENIRLRELSALSEILIRFLEGRY